MATSASSTNFANGLVPFEVARKIGFYSIEEIIKRFQSVSLHEMIRINSSTSFLSNTTKFCWRMVYNNLSLVAIAARDNYTDAIVANHTNGYVKQQMHSISGEQNDLCLYTYGPDDLTRFLETNKNNHYTFLPLTVHATESANGVRHDMLIIFDNRTRNFYWFDGHNRSDYLPFGKNIPCNAIDILFINLAETSKIGYTYEPAPSWQFPGVLHPYGSIGQLDFAFSTAWCYLTILMMNAFNSPMEYVSMLDSLSEADRFHLLYNALLHMVGVFKYHATVPANASVDFTAENVKLPVQPLGLPVIDPTVRVPTRVGRSNNVTQVQPQNLPTNAGSAATVSDYINDRDPPRISNNTLRHRNTSQLSEMQPMIDYTPMPIVASTDKPKNENCVIS